MQRLVLDSLDPLMERALLRAGALLVVFGAFEDASSGKPRRHIEVELPASCIRASQYSDQTERTARENPFVFLLPSGETVLSVENDDGTGTTWTTLQPADVIVQEATLEQILSRLAEVQLREERCPYCGTWHPRYFAEVRTDGRREILAVGWIVKLLRSHEEGKRMLSSPCLRIGDALLEKENHQQLTTIVDRCVHRRYTCEERIEQARIAYEEAMQRRNEDFITQMKRVLAMLADDYDWDAHWKEDTPVDLKEAFRECCVVENVAGQDEEEEKDDGPGQKECGSAEVDDTPRALYRLLYLFRPPKISFEDMYKSCLMTLSTPDKRFSVSIYLFKYELALYYYAESALVYEPQAGYDLQVRAGAPDSEAGISIQHEEGLLFFEMIHQALQVSWDIYPGNHFEV